jgi:hypothetical protein
MLLTASECGNREKHFSADDGNFKAKKYFFPSTAFHYLAFFHFPSLCFSLGRQKFIAQHVWHISRQSRYCCTSADVMSRRKKAKTWQTRSASTCLKINGSSSASTITGCLLNSSRPVSNVALMPRNQIHRA